jgi:hypothetical protein
MSLSSSCPTKLGPLLEKVHKLSSPSSLYSVFGGGLALSGLLNMLGYVFPSDNLCAILLLASSLLFWFAK